MLNNVVLMGRICEELELRKTPNGVSVVRFTIAVDRGYAKQGEEKKTDFLKITVWRSTAEFVCRNFRKGQMIAIQGSIETGSYEKDGVKRNTFEIVADNVSFCGSKNDGQGGNSSQDEPQATETAYGIDYNDSDDSLPF
jgi:single-strand DNA-binding protein